MFRTLKIVVAIVAVLGLAPRAKAQDAPPDVSKFMGGWTLSLDSPQGAFQLNFDLTQKDGKPFGSLTSDIAPPQDVTDISKSGDDLVLKYMGNFQGQSFDAKITLTLDGEKNCKVVFDVMGGQFVMNGTGTKK
jgi:hypothetical protein